MKPLVEAAVFDETGSMRAMFFNQPWLAQRYEPGTRLLLHGKTTARGAFNVAHHAVGSDLGAGETDAAREIGHYPATEGASSTQILTLMQASRGALVDMPEPLAASVRVREGVPDRASALAAMHFPHTAEDRERGRERLAFEELLLTQLVFLRRRARRRESTRAHRLDEPAGLSERWLRECLPFALTLRLLLSRQHGRSSPGARLAATVAALMIAIYVVRVVANLLPVGAVDGARIIVSQGENRCPSRRLER